MRHSMTIAAAGACLVGATMPALAQSYGYGPPPPAYAAPSSPTYLAPQPRAYGPPVPPPSYGPPPGTRCEASFEGEYRGRHFVCPMRVVKPVGAHCRCVAPPVAPGYPPGPTARGRVIP